MPSVHSSSTSPGSSTCRPLIVISGIAGSPPRQHSTKLRIGWVGNFFFGDLAFAQQQLDVAVIARAIEHLP